MNMSTGHEIFSLQILKKNLALKKLENVYFIKCKCEILMENIYFGNLLFCWWPQSILTRLSLWEVELGDSRANEKFLTRSPLDHEHWGKTGKIQCRA